MIDWITRRPKLKQNLMRAPSLASAAHVETNTPDQEQKEPADELRRQIEELKTGKSFSEEKDTEEQNPVNPQGIHRTAGAEAA